MSKRKSTIKDNKITKTKTEEGEIINIHHEINNIDDLIYLGNLYNSNKKYNINLEKLHKLVPILTKLKNVIGMDNIKKSITGQIIYFIQGFQDKNSDMLHTVIQGPPGVGKTMLGEIIGEIYYTLDIIQCNEYDLEDEDGFSCRNKFKFTVAKRSDFIGKYLGHTAIKTQEVINRSLGGVLFIDEAYSLGNEEGRDSFSKECIDTINQNLTEKKNQLLVIIAGYEKALNDCFFSYNEGLRRRFPFVYTIEKYTPQEMSRILQKMIKELGNNWDIQVNQKILDTFFDKNLELFPNSAGDIETLIFSIKMEHSKRVFGQPQNQHKKILEIDILNAFNIYTSNKKSKDPIKIQINHMMYI
jgi:SpoVK/Ycf46/Vps4 family AAA+-type ATPase